MDIEALEFRAACLQAARNFFITHQYLELDTPALSPTLIPESCLEVFRTEYLKPFKTGEEGAAVPLFLVPSPEVFIKPVIAAHGRSVFQLSKCYRNCESVGHIHNPEFTMLEYYTMQADYRDSVTLTEAFLQTMAQAVAGLPLADPGLGAILSKPFLQLTMDEAFKRFAGFSLAEAETPELAFQAKRLGLGDRAQYESWAWDDLYELLLVHCIEPQLPSDVPVALLDYPARVPCLAQERTEQRTAADGRTYIWKTKERWEVYVRGVELANCYTEARDAEEINRSFADEAAIKNATARVPHPVPENFGGICARMPPCSGVAMGFDRLIMLLGGKKTLSSFLYGGMPHN